MVLRICDANIQCTNPASRYSGNCIICGKHLCFEHLRPEYHKCPPADTDAYYAAYSAAREGYLAAILAKVNIEALVSVATKTRRGIPCRAPILSDDINWESRLKLASSQCGGQNFHLDIEFDDSVTWIARIRLQDPLVPPPEVQDYVFLSEIATLQFLAQTQVPSPKVYHYQAASPENPIGSSYILMEKIKGNPLDWNSAGPKQRSKVIQQLADIYLELEKHPLPMTGSLILSDTPDKIGGFAHESWFSTPTSHLGPFTTLEAAYAAVIHQHLKMIKKYEITSLPVDNYLSFMWRLKNLRALTASSVSSNGPFYLKHCDDKGDHILVDDDFNITGIIDWEFASAEGKELAFGSPCMMWPVGDYYDGINSLCADELEFAQAFDDRGRQDLGNIVRNGRQWQRFTFFLGGVPDNEVEFNALFHGLRSAFSHDGADISMYEDWKKQALALGWGVDGELNMNRELNGEFEH
ncbi:bf567ca9-d306-4a9c-b16c-6c8ce21c6b21 [Sclerotinia trifoliorum]|uniref:Bf567ca9-d306-4a9c-b16c-6c8ce21c6b21 n=1 Tax=Sclerotinia trifoliorum TaxID=28548 RepID=A0A8H2VX41_9HELO|nr:bf567ca9-d306-4a9c-b16c-6c8ce21c6b21 [Sclerotinia trifoliorum]